MTYDYMAYSHKVRNEIEAIPGIDNQLKDMFEWRQKPFGHGSSVNLHYMGKLQSGSHIALRAFKLEFLENEGLDSLDKQIKWMETYCQNAERHHKHGDDVPKFCVGVIYGDNAAILTEDIRQGRECDITQGEGDVEAQVIYKDTGKKRVVHLDLDPHYIPLSKSAQIKYFADPNVIRINQTRTEKSK